MATETVTVNSKHTRIKYVCEKCDSDDLVWTANVIWNVYKQQNDILNLFDGCFCNKCGDDTHAIKKEL